MFGSRARAFEARARELSDLNSSLLAAAPASVASVLRASGPSGMHVALLSDCLSSLGLPEFTVCELVKRHPHHEIMLGDRGLDVDLCWNQPCRGARVDT